jgi:hypothetical protein
MPDTSLSVEEVKVAKKLHIPLIMPGEGEFINYGQDVCTILSAPGVMASHFLIHVCPHLLLGLRFLAEHLSPVSAVQVLFVFSRKVGEEVVDLAQPGIHRV